MIEKILNNSGIGYIQGVTKSTVKSAAKQAELKGTSLVFMPVKTDLVKSVNQRINETEVPDMNMVIDVQELSQKLEKKVASYLKIIPQNSKMKAPLKFQAGIHVYEMLVDKSRELSKVSIKESSPIGDSMLVMGFDSKGRMMDGELFINGIYDRTDTLRFSRTNSNSRRIEYTEVLSRDNEEYSRTTSFLPIAGTTSWAPIKESLEKGKKPHGLSPNNTSSNSLEILFFELAGVKKTVF